MRGMLSVVVCSVFLMGSSCNERKGPSKAASLETAAGSPRPYIRATDEAGHAKRLTVGRRIIDSHMQILQRFSNEIADESRQSKILTVNISYSDVLLGLAMTEDAFAQTLTPEEVSELKAYAAKAFKPSEARIVQNLATAGISSGAKADIAMLSGEQHTTALAASAPTDINGGYCYVSGFIVYYTRCCANDAGRGVFVGTTGYGCCNLVACDGCPQMIPSCPH